MSPPVGGAHGAEGTDDLRARCEFRACKRDGANWSDQDPFPCSIIEIATSVETTPPNACRKIESVALCSTSFREALASEIIIVLKLRIAAPPPVRYRRQG